jgi:hypothetical protein
MIIPKINNKKNQSKLEDILDTDDQDESTELALLGNNSNSLKDSIHSKSNESTKLILNSSITKKSKLKSKNRRKSTLNSIAKNLSHASVYVKDK